MDDIKNLFTIPLINIWYVIVTLIFILMRITNIIDWSPIWILSPLWIPWAIAFSMFVVLFVLKCIVAIIDIVINLINKK